MSHGAEFLSEFGDSGLGSPGASRPSAARQPLARGSHLSSEKSYCATGYRKSRLGWMTSTHTM